jgi:hypothetical protein
MVLIIFGVIAAVATVFSFSRGGMLGLAGGIIFLFVTFSLCKGKRRSALIVPVFILLFLAGLFLLGDLTPVIERIETMEKPMEAGIERIAQSHYGKI